MEHMTLNVAGMSCGHCVQSIEGALKRLGAQGSVDLGAKSVSIEYDETILSLDSIKNAIEDQGYEVK